MAYVCNLGVIQGDSDEMCPYCGIKGDESDGCLGGVRRIEQGEEWRKELAEVLALLVNGDAPEPCAQAAVLHQRLGQWKEAIAMWDRARVASIGHNRRERYLEARQWCEKHTRRET